MIAWWWALIALYGGIALGIAVSTICREWAGSAADDASPRPKSRAAGGM